MITSPRVRLEHLTSRMADKYFGAGLSASTNTRLLVLRASVVLIILPFYQPCCLSRSTYPGLLLPFLPSLPRSLLLLSPPSFPLLPTSSLSFPLSSSRLPPGPFFLRLDPFDAETRCLRDCATPTARNSTILSLSACACHTKESILRQYQRPLANTRQAELETRLSEIFRIAALRLSDRSKSRR